jgi:hypothetical protein
MMNRWWYGLSRRAKVVFLVVSLAVVLALIGVFQHHHGSSGGGSSGFTASCSIEPVPGPGTFTMGNYPAVTFNNPTNQDESVQGILVTVILFDANGNQIGTVSVRAPAVIAAGQAVTTGTAAVYDSVPTGAVTCSVAPYQTSPG